MVLKIWLFEGKKKKQTNARFLFCNFKWIKKLNVKNPSKEIRLFFQGKMAIYMHAYNNFPLDTP